MRPTTLIFASLLLLGAAAAFAEVPPRTSTGQTLEVSESDFERGQIFYVHPGEDTQLALTSTASLQRVILTTSRAVGFVVGTFDPEDSQKPVLGGALRVPIAALASGSPSVDARLRGEGYLDGGAHPEISFELTGTGEVEKLASDDEHVFPFRMKLLGKVTALGATHEVEMAAEVRFLLTNFSTFARTAGDLITIAGSFEVEPADFGWEMPPRGTGLVGTTLAVDVFLVGSTLSPENNLDPDADIEAWLAQQRYLTLARDLADAEAAAAHGKEYLAKYGDDAGALDGLARLILDEPGLADRDLALVSQLAKRARELDAEGESITETLSRLAAARGE